MPLIYCSNLISIIIPNGVTSIANDAFSGCSSLIAIVNLNPIPVSIMRGAFLGIDVSSCTLYVPIGSKISYQSPILGWQNFKIFELPEISEDDITVTPSDSNALIEWQPFDNAEGYRIIIYSDEAHTDTIFILEFDADGEWFNTISFRSASKNISYTIEELQKGTDYFYTLEILGVGNAVLASLSGEFITTGVPTSVDIPLAEPAKIIGYYSVSGAKLPKVPEKGMYIVLYSNGTSEKILK